MIIEADRKFVAASFDNEEEIERVVIAHAAFIFGPDSIILPKSLIRSAEGFGTIPDGFAIDFSARRWFIVEAELSSHSVWTHIAPQVSKQIVAAQQHGTRKRLIEVVIDRIREDAGLREQIEELGIPEIDIRRVLTEIMESRPIIGIPIDHVSTDLREWAQTLKNEVKLWIVRKLVEFRDPAQVLYEIPDEYRPVFDSSAEADEARRYADYDVTISDLLEVGKLTPGQRLFMSYKPRGGARETRTDSNKTLHSTAARRRRCNHNRKFSRPTCCGHLPPAAVGELIVGEATDACWLGKDATPTTHLHSGSLRVHVQPGTRNRCSFSIGAEENMA
ncbi:MAG: hypothetical protein KA118_01150 [Verrucomicrobia bacterium]|nr:hypothetical protein [Verrucomicrobiota bacterium]